MSSKMHSTVKWDSSEEEDDMTDAKFRMKLREPYGKNAQPVESSTMESESAEPRRRGRGPSKRPCLNRNALMARENRQRKKAYLEKIENKLSFYQEENKTLVNTIRKQGIDIKRLSGEVAYLRSVLNNNTAIAALLKTINEGLRKIGSSKRSAFPSAPSQPPRPDSSSLQEKCTYATTPGIQKEKESRPTDNSNNMYVDSSDDFTGYHSTYNSLENASFHLKRDTEHKEGSSLGTTVSSLSQESEDSYTDNIKDLDSILPMANIGSIGDKRANSEQDPLSTDFDQLPSFNMDIFEDLPKCDEMIAIDGLHDSTSLFAEEEMFPSLDNTGICLHVNSDKVSLEYCALCHSNSKGAALN